MEIYVCKDSKELGEKAAQHVGKILDTRKRDLRYLAYTRKRSAVSSVFS